ncbi:MAG: substrate-binding domain-containing protein [Candidatus Competibacter sp.]|nr:substrate-binding domain-containing protein [Candidatus Competibacter sp.]
MTKKEFALAVFMVTAIATGASNAQPARDYVTIVGSYVIQPMAMEVAQQFSKTTQAKLPQVQANGTGAGFKSFCAGVDIETPDATTSTRLIRSSELDLCKKNGVTEIVEVRFGYDAIVAAHARGGKVDELNRKELFLAMAKDIPDPKDGSKLIPNPYKTWKDINPALPDSKIQIWGPDPSLGIYDAHLTQIMLVGCKQFDSIKTLETSDPKAFEAVCRNFRRDGAYTEFADYNIVLRELKNNQDALGIIAFSISRKADLKEISVDGTEPTLISISRNAYSLTFPLLAYVKKARVNLIPSLKGYLAELTSEKAIGTTGYLYSMGVVPMPLLERNRVRADVDGLKLLPM